MQLFYGKSKIAKNYTRIINVTRYNCIKFEQKEKWQLYNFIIQNVIHLNTFVFISRPILKYRTKSGFFSRLKQIGTNTLNQLLYKISKLGF